MFLLISNSFKFQNISLNLCGKIFFRYLGWMASARRCNAFSAGDNNRVHGNNRTASMMAIGFPEDLRRFMKVRSTARGPTRHCRDVSKSDRRFKGQPDRPLPSIFELDCQLLFDFAKSEKVPARVMLILDVRSAFHAEAWSHEIWSDRHCAA